MNEKVLEDVFSAFNKVLEIGQKIAEEYLKKDNIQYTELKFETSNWFNNSLNLDSKKCEFYIDAYNNKKSMGSVWISKQMLLEYFNKDKINE